MSFLSSEAHLAQLLEDGIRRRRVAARELELARDHDVHLVAEVVLREDDLAGRDDHRPQDEHEPREHLTRQRREDGVGSRERERERDHGDLS